MNEKQTFLQIRAAHNLSLESLAELAQVPIEDIYYLEAGVSYPDAFIECVLHALSALTGEGYTRENVGGIYAERAEDGRI
jgi:hypothetical protein